MNHRNRILTSAAFLLSSLALSDASAQVVELGTSCGVGGASAPSLSVAGAPIDGQTFGLELRSDPGPGDFLVLAGFSQISPAQNIGGYPGCQLHVTPSLVLPLPPDTNGDIDLVVPTWAAGLSIYLQAVRLDPSGPIGFTNGLCITSMAAPANDGVSDFSPEAGGIGTELSIVGSGFDTSMYGDKDIYIKGVGNRSFYGRSTKSLGTGVVGEIFHTAKYPEPTPVELHFGQGADVTLSPIFGALPDGPAWVWTADANDDVFKSGTDFDPAGSTIFGDCDEDELLTLDLKFELVNGDLVLNYPDDGNGNPAPLCLSDRISVLLSFTRANGDDVVLRADFIPQVTNWNQFGIAMITQLSAALTAQTGGQCFFSSFTGTSMTLSCASGSPIASYDFGSHIRVKLDADDHVMATDQGGMEDNYAAPIEATTPETLFDTFSYNYWIAPYTPVHQPRYYDTTGSNKHFWDSLSDFGSSSSTPVRNACLELRLKGDSAQTYTDGIILGWNGNSTTPGWDWSISLNNIPADGQWNPGDDAVLRLDLSQLPNADGTTTNILNALSDGSLEITVVDDTVVDFTRLTVVRCGS